MIKIHPQFEKCTNEIKKYFKSLTFSSDRIDKLLKNASSLITLSSGTIEDGLNSQVPVILYDKNSRYKQMKILKIEEENQAVHYVNKKEDLGNIIENIKNYKNIKFDSYIYHYDFNEILYNKVLTLAKYEKRN